MKASEYFMLEELTTDLIQVLNKYYPRMTCDLTDPIDEEQVKKTIDFIAQLNLDNLNKIYPSQDG